MCLEGTTQSTSFGGWPTVSNKDLPPTTRRYRNLGLEHQSLARIKRTLLNELSRAASAAKAGRRHGTQHHCPNLMSVTADGTVFGSASCWTRRHCSRPFTRQIDRAAIRCCRRSPSHLDRLQPQRVPLSQMSEFRGFRPRGHRRLFNSRPRHGRSCQAALKTPPELASRRADATRALQAPLSSRPLAQSSPA